MYVELLVSLSICLWTSIKLGALAYRRLMVLGHTLAVGPAFKLNLKAPSQLGELTVQLRWNEMMVSFKCNQLYQYFF